MSSLLKMASDLKRIQAMSRIHKSHQRHERLRLFWERMADRCPSPFNTKSLADIDKFIGLVEARVERGIPIWPEEE
jgi:hypothetical protein